MNDSIYQVIVSSPTRDYSLYCHTYEYNEQNTGVVLWNNSSNGPIWYAYVPLDRVVLISKA